MAEFSMDRIRTHRWKLVVLLSLFLMSFLFAEHLIPTVKEITRLRRLIHQENHADGEGRLGGFDHSRIIEQTQVLKARLDSLVFNNDREMHTSRIIHLLSSIAKADGVDILSIRPGEVRSGEDFVVLPVAFTLRSGYHPIGTFVSHLESSNLIVEVETMNLKAEDMASSGLTADIQMMIYYLRQTT